MPAKGCGDDLKLRMENQQHYILGTKPFIDDLHIGKLEMTLDELLDKIFADGQTNPLRADWAYYLASKVKELSDENEKQKKEILFLKNVIKEGMLKK